MAVDQKWQPENDSIKPFRSAKANCVSDFFGRRKSGSIFFQHRQFTSIINWRAAKPFTHALSFFRCFGHGSWPILSENDTQWSTVYRSMDICIHILAVWRTMPMEINDSTETSVEKRQSREKANKKIAQVNVIWNNKRCFWCAFFQSLHFDAAWQLRYVWRVGDYVCSLYSVGHAPINCRL